MRLLTILALAALLGGCGGPRFAWPEPLDPGPVTVLRDDMSLALFADGLEKPVMVVQVPDVPETVLVAEQAGRIQAFVSGVRADVPFLDISDRVGTCHEEQGLLGLAFSPTFAADGRLYVTYTTTPCGPGKDKPVGDLVLARFTRGANASRVEAATQEILLVVQQPYRNHNGGHVVFGPDGMLYVGVGDGGGHRDPQRTGQDKDDLLGSILRIDVSGPGAYTVPADNPFAGANAGRDEVWIFGVRNPWRFSFDALLGDLWIADVGEDRYEEVNHLAAGTGAGANLGWSLYEAGHRFRGQSTPEVVWPVAEYGHDEENCSITGGPVLRGSPWSDFEGAFLFADFCSGLLWAAQWNGTAYQVTTLMDTGLMVTGFGVGADGAIYLTHWAGSVHRLTAAATTAPTPVA